MSYLMKPMSYVLVIILGYTLKRAGFLSGDDRSVLSKIMMSITLPCTIIQGFSGFERNMQLFWLVGIGLLCALLPILGMYACTRGVEKKLRVYRMLNIGGYNIGCFSLPLLEGFFGAGCVVPAFMFDTGNAIVMTGGAYALTSTLLQTGGESREGLKEIVLKFLRSLPFDTYLVMFVLNVLNVRIPDAVFVLTKPAGQANAFLAMLIIGLMFEPMGDKALIRETARELAIRYAFAAVSAAVSYYLLPFDPVIRRTLVLLCFAPLSSLAPIYTGRCHGDVALAGFTNSISILISLICMMALSLAFVA